MRTLVIKLGAAGDVVRTTPLLRRLDGPVTWITSAANAELVRGLPGVRCLTWEQRGLARSACYDLVLNLEDGADVARFARSVDCARLYGAYADDAGPVRYTDDAGEWFDLGLISVHGGAEANRRKLANRRTYQDLLFAGLGFAFGGERYVLPDSTPTGLTGDVAIAPDAGPAWPMKRWPGYDTLRLELQRQGIAVNVLAHRPSLRQHLADVRGHRCLVSGDSLPMHAALGTGTRCVTLFTCTSPWEIHDYGLQHKVVSPRLAECFYRRDDDPRAAAAIPLEDVLSAVTAALAGAAPVAS